MVVPVQARRAEFIPRPRGVALDFYRGRVLRIDLSAGTAEVEPLNMEWAERYIGGKGLLLRYMWEYVPPQVDPWAPENPVFLVTGPFAGTNVSTASRLVVGAKSPVTGILDDSYVGGSFAPEMKFAGYDLIVIVGKALQPTVLWIKNDKVEFVPAREKYWGLKTSAIEEALRTDLDKDAKVLSIGPAGENLVPWACLSTDQFHKAGRGGHGALFGAKNLKAVAIRGTGSVRVGEARAFLADMVRIHREHVLTDSTYGRTKKALPFWSIRSTEPGRFPPATGRRAASTGSRASTPRPFRR
jgi:aldehyde:ferredoxin oxidoreductase